MPRNLETVLDGHAQALSYQGKDRKLFLRRLAERDLFFFMTCILQREDMRHQWVLDRCDEVEASPDGYLDLWARYHYKSSIGMGLLIRDSLVDPEVTICVFSYNRPVAKQFLKQIKVSLETNVLIREFWPERLWERPSADAPSWSLDGGLVLPRKSNPKEATFEAFGVVEGQPTGRHFHICAYDDLVTRDNAYTPEMRAKTIGAWEMSLNLGVIEGTRRRYYGTRYHFEDAYNEIIRRGAAIPRIHAAEIEGKPVLLSREELDNRRRELGPVTFASQMMLDPKADDAIGFKQEWLRYWSGRVAKSNRYMLVDPANETKKKSDYTAIWVVDLCEDGNIYVRDVCRDRLSLPDRLRLVMEMHREWSPKIVGYEKYGMQADIQALQMEMDREGYRFTVQELGGKLSKHERICRLMPLFEDGRIWLPRTHNRLSKDEGQHIDMINAFVQDEFLAWPYSGHDDMLDSLSRVVDEDLNATYPKRVTQAARQRSQRRRSGGSTSWMAA